ncbi:hypothetical protein KAE78_08235 [Microbacterium sp. NIBRBAC000506063]|nr:hypothetical protein KAE78_08235 [Microbacterium sp. NIBRBAC000506063]
MTSRVGTSLPAHTTSAGKALLAELPPTELHRRLPSEELTRLTRARMRPVRVSSPRSKMCARAGMPAMRARPRTVCRPSRWSFAIRGDAPSRR